MKQVYVAQAGLELGVLFYLPTPNFWDYRPSKSVSVALEQDSSQRDPLKASEENDLPTTSPLLSTPHP